MSNFVIVIQFYREKNLIGYRLKRLIKTNRNIHCLNNNYSKNIILQYYLLIVLDELIGIDYF